jgi:enterochelin esterase family protein
VRGVPRFGTLVSTSGTGDGSGSGERLAPGSACATFLWSGPARRVIVAGDLNGWSRGRDLLQRIPGTDLFHGGYELPADGRVDYKLIVDGRWTLDPLNPRTLAGGYGPNSELRLPAYRPPPEVERRPGVPAGTVEPLTLRSRHLGNGRKARVYLPAGYPAGTARYPVVYLQDGEDTLAYGAVDAILDNLIAGGTLPPLIAVLVPPVRREAEYLRNPAFEGVRLHRLGGAGGPLADLLRQLAPGGSAAGGARGAGGGRGATGAAGAGLASGATAAARRDPARAARGRPRGCALRGR